MLHKIAKETVQKTCQDTGIFLMRLALGLFFLFHGSQKLFGVFEGLGLGGYANLIEGLQLPYPQYISVAIAAAEFFGGAMLILGVYSRTAAGLLAITLFACAYYVQQDVVAVYAEPLSYRLNLAYLLVGLGFTLLGLALTGPGSFKLAVLQNFKPSLVSSVRRVAVIGESSVGRPRVEARPHIQ